jgi:hypothetical protein
MASSHNKIEKNLYSIHTHTLSFIVNLIDFVVSQNGEQKVERERESKRKKGARKM